jgi:UDP-N-acetylglucosamine--N-acetylmuramyl-(pentapeptide) pyrophosphoryl-undecaprenol N-acetylglucosamine transferase
VPTVLILGGSLGSKRVNETVLGGLSELVKHVNVIHQTGKDNFAEVTATAQVILAGNSDAARYHAYPYLSVESLRQAAAAAHIIVSRAGATTIAEIALWQRPSILIPIPESISHDQRTNAYAYAHTGAAIVLEEENLSPHVLLSEITRIAHDPALARKMGERSSAFAETNAARIIAEELLRIALRHEPEPSIGFGQLS